MMPRHAQAAARRRASVTLRRRQALPVWASLLLRLALALGLIAIALVGHWFYRDGLRDTIDGHISFIDVLYFTMITVASVGYGDIVPVTDHARLFDTFVVTPIRLFVWLIFLGTAYNFLIRRTMERWRMALIQRTLQDHVVVAGYGTSGSEAVNELIARGAHPSTIVVVDSRAEAREAAEQIGCIVVDGDATRDATLEAVRIAQARAMIVTAGRDDTSILIVLTARRLAERLPIGVAIRAGDNEPLARQAGANTVINPASFTGILLASSTHGSHIADYMADLASATGRVALGERRIVPAEIGTPLSALTTGLGVRIYRDGVAYGYWEPEAQSLRTGDVVVEIVHNRNPV